MSLFIHNLIQFLISSFLFIYLWRSKFQFQKIILLGFILASGLSLFNDQAKVIGGFIFLLTALLTIIYGLIHRNHKLNDRVYPVLVGLLLLLLFSFRTFRWEGYDFIELLWMLVPLPLAIVWLIYKRFVIPASMIFMIAWMWNAAFSIPYLYRVFFD